MEQHPIDGLMDAALRNIKSMVDVNTIIGDPVSTPDGTIIIPISTVSFGFGAGGSEFSCKGNVPTQDPLFGGGCGGGAKVKPVAFLVVGNGNIRLLPMDGGASPVDKLIDLMPEMVDKVNGAVSGLADKIMTKRKKAGKEKKEAGAAQEELFVDVVDPAED